MFEVTVRDRMMIAHSFSGAVFGPARRLHGATYVVDVTFFRPQLDGDGLVVDIGAASRVLAGVVGEFNLSNLDEHPELAGRNTTTEFMAGVIFERVRQAIDDGALGPHAAGLTRLRVSLAESDVASAAFESPL